MEQRTVEEIKAYADGYNDCYNQFIKSMQHKSRLKAIHEMHDVFLKAVNDCVYKGQEHEYE